jgi:arylsulfatase A-like enzyme
MTPLRLLVIVLSLVALAGCGSATNLPSAFDGQPNILLIVADNLGYGDLGQHHTHNYYSEILSPNGERGALDNKLPKGEIGSAAGYSVERNEYSHDLIADEALGFIAQSVDRPFFLALTLTIPHANDKGHELGMEVPDLGVYADKPWPEPVKRHAAMISRMDADIVRLMSELE